MDLPSPDCTYTASLLNVAFEDTMRLIDRFKISATFKPLQTLCQRLVASKYPTELDEKTGVIYHIPSAPLFTLVKQGKN